MKDFLGKDQLIFKMALTPLELDEVYRLVWQVYSESGYISLKDYPDCRLRDKYEKYSVYFIARDKEKIIGAVRLIINSPKLYVEEDFNVEIPVNKERIAEVSRLVILNEHRKRNHYLSLRLLKMALNFSEDKNLTHWIFVMSKELKRYFSRFGAKLQLLPIYPLLPENLETRKKLPGYYQKEIFPYIISLEEAKKGLKKVNDFDNKKKASK